MKAQERPQVEETLTLTLSRGEREPGRPPCDSCGCTDFYARKNFPPKIGLTIVVIAAIAFLVLSANARTFHLGVAVLAGAVLLDAIVYLFVPKVAVCYRCGKRATHLASAKMQSFELSVAEKYRQQP